MGFRLSPRPGQSHRTPDEIVRRLRDEFAVVEADRDAGADHVGDMIAQFLRMKAPEEIVEAHRRAQPEAIQVRVADDPLSDDDVTFVARPGADLIIGCYSEQHERAIEGLIRRCAEVLGYESHLL